MQRPFETVYALGRLAFGASLIANPELLGPVLVGKRARKPIVRTMFRFYGTRDTVLGLGTLRAAVGGGDAAPWVAGGIASDVLDTLVLLTEWEEIPSGKRLPGVLAALGAGAAGVALLVRR